MYENMYRDQKSSLDVALQVLPTLCFETVFQGDLGLTDNVGWPGSCHLSLNIIYKHTPPCRNLYLGTT